MVTIAIAVMIVAAFAVVAYPLLNNTRETGSLNPGRIDPALESLVVQRDATYAAIKDLEFDHAMGKLSDGDFKSMRAKYEAKAASILQELDNSEASHQRKRPAANADAIEREVQTLRQRSQNPARASGSAQSCPKCGTPHTASDAFCSKCGTSLRGARCPNCGTRAAIGDKFCARCGGRIGSGS